MSEIGSILAYLTYWLRAKTKHGVHSPFVFNLLTSVIKINKTYYAYESIERIRAEMLHNKNFVEVVDLGAGSTHLTSNKRKIAAIAKHSLKSPKYGQLLFRLVDHFQPRVSLELGTSLGITTLYIAAANKKARVISIEGSQAIANVAIQNFKKMDATNIKLVVGNFDDTLTNELKNIKQLDLVFFDGNHRKEPTLRYFEQCLQLAHNDSVFIFDDIHWSDEMEEAWKIIKQHKQITLTIDLFFLGLVFFRKEQVKEHFVLKF